MIGASEKRRRFDCIIGGWLLLCAPVVSHGGAFVFAIEDIGVEVITHPPGYLGVGGVLDIEVCIDASAVDSNLLEIPIQNAIKVFNRLEAEVPNLKLGGDNDIPAGAIDFQSLATHEIGHCIGLGHPNLGVRTGISGSDTDFTASGDGDNGDPDLPDEFELDAGDDGVIGSGDDVRGDDQNLHWFAKGINNPFLEVLTPGAATYSRDLADLPDGALYAANAGRAVGDLLGVPNTEAVMQQGQFPDEDQRALQADDVAMLRMGMSGLDEISGTADDYTINLVYGGIKDDVSDCDLTVDSRLSGFGVCEIEGFFLHDGPHTVIEDAFFYFNSNINFYYNQAALCTAADDSLQFENVTINTTELHEACSSISYESGFTVDVNGSVTARAPTVTLGPNTLVNGVFRVETSIP